MHNNRFPKINALREGRSGALETERSLSKVWVKLRGILRPRWSVDNDKAELSTEESPFDGLLPGEYLKSQ